MASRTFFRRPAVQLALALCAVAAAITLLGRLSNGPQLQEKRLNLANTAGVEQYPSFSPDGRQLVYSARGMSKDDAFHIFVRPLPSGRPRQLTFGGANDIGPVWSPEGANIAFLRVADDGAGYVVIPAAGGAERKIAGQSTEIGPPASGGADASSALIRAPHSGPREPAAETARIDQDRRNESPPSEAQSTPALSWTRDGKSLALVISNGKRPAAISLVSLATGAAKKVTAPPQDSEGDSSPAISPDGVTLAFVRSGASGKSDIYLCDLAGGGLRRLTFDDKSVRGLVWMPTGHTLLYASDRASGWQLWRLSASGGSPREILISGKRANYPAVSAKGTLLAYTESPSVESIWRAELGSGPPADRPLLRSAGNESHASYSPDGKRIADVSDATGNDEIWTSDANGDNRVRVTDWKGPRLGRPRWSPDGKWLLFEVDGDHGSESYKCLAEPASKPVRVLIGAGGASWSQDGKSIYFQSHGQIWKAAADGGAPEQLTRRPGSGNPEASADGKYVYYRNRRTIWRTPTAGGVEEEVAEPEHDFLGPLQPVKKGIYYLEFERATRGMVVSFYDFETKQSSIAFRMSRRVFSSAFSVSPDGKYILYPKVDQSQTNLMLVEGFH